MINGAGRTVDKKQSCGIQLNGGTITIHDSGGVGDSIGWTVVATDGSGNSAETACQLEVVNPAQGGKDGSAKVTICHRGETKSISTDSLAGHLAHGDTEGPCDADDEGGESRGNGKKRANGK